jgi:hypothetical protein
MDAKERLIALQESKSKYLNGQDLLSSLKADSELMREVRYLTKVYLHRTLTGCSSCAMDAYIELTHIKPTDYDMEEKLYEIFAGAIYDPTVDDHFNNTTLTDEISERILKHNKAYIKHFRKFPEDWEKRVANADNDEKTAELVLAAVALIEADPTTTKAAVVKALREGGAKAKDAEAAFVAAVKSIEEAKAAEGDKDLD